jgi:hypothetical protein
LAEFRRRAKRVSSLSLAIPAAQGYAKKPRVT